MLKRFLELLFPSKCVLCGKLLEKQETDLCKNCRINGPDCEKATGKLRFLDSWTAVWYYDDKVRSSIHRYKFGNARHYADCYGRLLAMKISRQDTEFDVLTWVPISFARRVRRGYDQSQLLAEAVGRELCMEPVSVLKKIRNNPPQSGFVGEARRRANVLGAYRVIDPDILKNKRVLLLDDVITTGATAGECARVMLTAGAKEVHCGAVAAAGNHGNKK